MVMRHLIEVLMVIEGKVAWAKRLGEERKGKGLPLPEVKVVNEVAQGLPPQTSIHVRGLASSSSSNSLSKRRVTRSTITQVMTDYGVCEMLRKLIKASGSEVGVLVVSFLYKLYVDFVRNTKKLE